MKLKNYLSDWLYKYVLSFYDRFINPFYQKSYSQEGEDLVVQRIMENKKYGFYVDVGAHHPKRFSNTYLFYKKGWRGINIEPLPGRKKLFDKIRPEDINIEAAISDKNEKMSYFIFEESALNTFLQQKKNDLINDVKSNYLHKIELETFTLENILDKFLPSGKHIDLLSIDTEGFDFRVLNSNNWDKYRPTVVLVEDKDFTFNLPEKSIIFIFLTSYKYTIVAKTFKTLIFINENNFFNNPNQ